MNKIVKVIFILGFVCCLLTNIYASDVDVDFPTASGDISKVEGSAKTFWATFRDVAQILSVAAIVFAGIRYMFAAPDERADIKKGMIILVIGAVLVFGTVSVIKLVDNAWGDVLVY